MRSIVQFCRQSRTSVSLIFALVSLLAVFSAIPAPIDARRLPWLGGTKLSVPISRIPSLQEQHQEPQFLSPIDGKQLAWTATSLARLRGGADETTEDDTDDTEEDAADEERYSRQVYTMGARAHALVRSSTVYVDGPLRSGLLWESVKNLALSGVGKIVLIVDASKENQNNYHAANLDDLGNTYIRGALAEVGRADEDESSTSNNLEELFVEFVRRLNPALEVSTLSKNDFASQAKATEGGILLCLDRPSSHQSTVNYVCRQAGVKFVAVETAGVFGRVFCDFGPKHEIHDLDGETPLVVPLDRVEALVDDDSAATKLLVKSVEGEKHDVSRDDIVVFQRSDGSIMEEIPCRVTKVRNPFNIEVEVTGEDCPAIDKINAEAVTFRRQKQIQEVAFRPLRETQDEPIFGGEPVFTPCDLDKSFDETRQKAVFASFEALGAFAKKEGRLPTIKDEEVFLELVKEHSAADALGDGWETHATNFVRTSAAKFVPLQAIFGAIASQECLKGVSGLYNPIQQFLLYDCDEVCTEAAITDEGEDGYCGLSYILGKEVTEVLQNQNVFVVGSGAIGCELLKNLAAMGGGTGSKKGSIVVTDMDTIEKSNLSRQLLFRDSDIGNFKSKAAEEAVARLNPTCKVESHTSKVGDEEDPGPFDGDFWSSKVDVILNALDNMEARLFMDDQCVANQKALVDAGTLGSKGNVQVVVPHQSESYGSSVDPPEPGIPVCTLKNFPYAISHTIQWGRDLFDGLFVRRPRQANQHAEIFKKEGIDGVVRKLDTELGDEAALEAAKELAEDLPLAFGSALGADALKKLCIEWAINLGKELFRNAIEGLLEEHPVDELDEDGDLFWSGSRKPPKPLSFSLEEDGGEQPLEAEIHKNTIEFVRSAARLRYETYTGNPSNTHGKVSVEEARQFLTSSDSKTTSSPIDANPSNLSKVDAIHQQLKSFKNGSNSPDDSPQTLSALEFEKDDDTNGHIAFITAASNLRAICYGIAPVDAMETRKVAGKIIPAMITTTAFVSALSCLEWVKLAQGVPLSKHRNAFINLALPFFAFTAPMPAEEFDGIRGETHTLWDKITIQESKKAAKKGGITLKRLLRKLQKKAYDEDPDAVVVSNISIGPIMVYANFLHEDDDELLNTSIWEVIENAIRSGEEFDAATSRDGPGTIESGEDEAKDSSSPSDFLASFVDLAVSVEDTETFDEVELPQVRLFRSK